MTEKLLVNILTSVLYQNTAVSKVTSVSHAVSALTPAQSFYY